MEKSAPVCLILTCFFTVALCQFNMYIAEEKTWQEARNYCMEHHTDLTTIRSTEENWQISIQPARHDKVWIGLSKDGIDNWKWVGGENVTFNLWNETKFNVDNNCVVQRENGWHDDHCDQKHHFFCVYHNLVLVKENKTWEEAMELCHDKKKDLVSLPSASALTETIAISQGAQTDLVWTGLRYLADRWLWVSGETRSHVDAPQCPGWSHRCGALSLTKNNVVAWDCAAELNFVCANKNSF